MRITELLSNKGIQLGAKVETNGSGGAKNGLTQEEIENCDGVIIAADKNIETARFDGKPAIFTKVADGIHKPEVLINKIVNKEVAVYHETAKRESSISKEGAIPYAAKEPLKVIPSCIVGSAVAGGLSMAFKCALRAPHGGIFVVPVIQDKLIKLQKY